MLCVIGCGNLTRSDDGVGVVVVRRLLEQLQGDPLLAGVNLIDAGTGGMDVMFRARGARKLVIIDASRSGSQPGAVFQVPGAELAREREAGYSLHDFRWDHALYAGRRIFGQDFPDDVTVFLVEAGSLEFGLELTAPVRRAAEQVVDAVLGIIRAGAAASPAADTVRIARGSVYIDQALHQRYLSGAESVAILRRDDGIYVLPLAAASAGGLLLKHRNARGDRVVHAQEFLRSIGIDADAPEREVPVRWVESCGGLRLEGVGESPMETKFPD